MGFWLNFVIAIALNAISYLLTPKPETANPAAADDVDVPKLPYGTPYGILQGTMEIKSAGHAWHGDVSAQAIKKSGGKK